MEHMVLMNCFAQTATAVQNTFILSIEGAGLESRDFELREALKTLLDCPNVL